MTDIYDRLTEYCLHGGLYNPELMQHEKVRDLLIDCRAEIDRLRLAIRRLADQDATLSVCKGGVTVEMDATPEILDQFSQQGGQLVPFDPPQPTLTADEREAVAKAVKDYEDSASTFYERSMHAAARKGMKQAVVMRGLLERLGGER